ncbi:MAG: sodium:proton antiporter [Planctomycetes bacterium]|nr:sodium:proton antiporter [Planctomycetota bacterium]
MKVFGFIAVFITGLLLVIAANDFPEWASADSPASTHLSPHYITQCLKETAVPNMVTAVLADYRGYDTMFETAVIFTAGVAVVLILRNRRKNEEDLPPHGPEPTAAPKDIIVQSIVRLLAPFIQLYALYVVMHGHHSPGGGFQGGVMLGASFILIAISHDLKTGLDRMNERTNRLLGAVGVLIYAGIGAICLLLGANFLDYGGLSRVLPATDEIMARSHGMLGIEIGVAIAVMAIMMSIYVNLASEGRFKRGL